MSKTAINSLKLRVTLAITGVLIVSLFITTVFLRKMAKDELSNAIEENALNLIEATERHVELQHKSILYHKDVMMSRRKVELKNNVTLIFEMIRGIYDQYEDGLIRKEDARKYALNSVKQARYDEGVGYFWINDITRPIPRMIMHPTIPNLDGQILDDEDFYCALGEQENLFKAFVDVCLENGEGYVDYLWPKPINETLTEKREKLSYVKLYEDLGWVVGSGVYIDDIEKYEEERIDAVVSELTSILGTQAIGQNGYFFIFSEEEEILVHPNIQGRWGNSLIEPLSGKPLLGEFKKAAFSESQSVEYLWDKPGRKGEYIFPKVAYMTYYEPLGWYIGATVYKDELEDKIASLTHAMVLFAISFLLVALLIALHLSKSITKPLIHLISNISNLDKEGFPRKIRSSTRIREIRILSKTIDRMIDSVRISGRELKAERDFSYDLINTSPNIICGLDSKGMTRFINPSGERITGYKMEEIIGKNWWKLLFPTVANVPEADCVSLNSESRAVEMTLLSKNGDVREIVWSSFQKKDDEGRVVEIVGFGTDITERKKIEKELLDAKERAEMSNRLKSAFLANMSHEIRTPMNGILGFSSLLKEPKLTGDEKEKYIQIIEESGERLIHIINDLVDISLIESDQMKISMEETDINEQLEFLFDFFKPLCEEKSIKLSFVTGFPNGESTIISDREKLYAILTNLLRNAVKFSEGGAIVFGYLKKEEKLEFFVKDTGIGIPENRKDAIFERFVQADIQDRNVYEGCGLGLSISKSYVEMLGGDIWVESEEGKGSNFYFSIPCRIKRQQDCVFDTSKSKDRTSKNKRTLSVLVVEDDEDINARYLTLLVKDLSKCVLYARNGVEAVEICKTHPDIDLVLMDMKMPEMDGFEATRRIREFNKETVIIAQTAYALRGDRDQVLKAGCNDYVQKPIEKDLLLEKIKKYFEL